MEALLWIVITVLVLFVLGFFLIIILGILCGALEAVGTVAAAGAWVLEKVANALPDPAERKNP